MKSVLFLTYYFPPCNATGANRPDSFARNLSRHGHDVTVITRHWAGNEKTWADQLRNNMEPLQVIRYENLDVHYLPYRSYRHSRVGFIDTLSENLKGNFNYEAKFQPYANYIQKVIDQKQFDYIMVSVPPLTVLKTAAAIGKKIIFLSSLTFAILRMILHCTKKKDTIGSDTSSINS